MYVYVPSQCGQPRTRALFMVVQGRPGLHQLRLPVVLDNMIHDTAACR